MMMMTMLTRQGVLLMPMTPSVLPRGAQATASHPPDTSRFHKNFLLSTSTSIVPHIHRPSYPSSLLSIAPIIHNHIHRPSCISTSTSLFLPLLSSVHPSYPQNTPLIHKTSLILKPSLLSRRHPYYPQNTPVNHKTSLILKPSLLSTRHPSFPESIRHPIFKRLNMISNC